MNIQGITDIFEDGLESQMISSDLQTCNIADLKSIVDAWKLDGYTIVFTAGVFDIFTINHLLGLYHYKLLGGEKTKLIVSMDTDERVRSSKSFIEDKGDSIKPILSWRSRAIMVGKQSFLNREKLVDMITQHGSDTCGGVVCPHDDNVSIAEEISPDYIVVTSTSTSTIKKIQASDRIQSNRLLVINEEELAYEDVLIGKKISTSAIIKRIKYAR